IYCPSRVFCPVFEGFWRPRTVAPNPAAGFTCEPGWRVFGGCVVNIGGFGGAGGVGGGGGEGVEIMAAARGSNLPALAQRRGGIRFLPARSRAPDPRGAPTWARVDTRRLGPVRRHHRGSPSLLASLPLSR